ncbi:4-hydroxythreonine-4-phosphate dehydrogenase PdxA [Legionella waltersii]|uniref:4-hydroxythreonine-4-phosphate dehydrogenase n=1 Tax=Legionella waltersii TaxID=66969 RepID=A0A0W1ADP8_9GAMM|nr:4-hydroxythreonine-4-phosphate dehydrogenase PdxA [Legionella waltersii]KTD79396.1 4-hydroxythreonine-4-phosphate dehydrogenase [Legionella waltersii]SNU97889.1 4-hydroxythreonine-4-phosphate dehydrogenase [Legionella waltersii]
MKPLLVSSGEPAGVGPDLCLALADLPIPIVVLGDIDVLRERAATLKQTISLNNYLNGSHQKIKPGCLNVYQIPCPKPVKAGILNSENAPYVMDLLKKGASLCASKEFSALVTAPVHKANINEGGFPFTGHTEFFAEYFGVETVVMMLTCQQMRVALVTTHLPLSSVPKAITKPLIVKVIEQVHQSLKEQFAIKKPHILVAGLNPHAGESGYLGREEIEVISPALRQLQESGIDVKGPLPADTLFINEKNTTCDAYVAMYHDQGLPVIKYAGFNDAVNVTLGLPIIRTSVDHGTALELAGKGIVNCGSMIAAVKLAQMMALNRNTLNANN